MKSNYTFNSFFLKTVALFATFFCFYYTQAQTVYTFNYTGSIVNWVVPPGVTNVKIEAFGAEGGSATGTGGKGACMQGNFTLVPGSTIKILVGERPPANGGGGGSFVTDIANAPLIIAGGGGGGAGPCCGGINNGDCGQLTTAGSKGVNPGNVVGAGGVGGNGGSRGFSGQDAGAGGGLSTNGAAGDNLAQGGVAFISGGAGGATNNRGGFGGGGTSHCSGSGCAGGAGGGYSGGGSSGGGSSWGAGGGGGSINNGTGQVNTTCCNSGNGLVRITSLYSAIITQSTAVSCFGATDAVLTGTVSGGTPGYTYTWTPGGVTSPTLSGIGAGVYTLTVKDALANVTSISYTVTQPSVITTTMAFTNADCGSSNGSATITPSGGTPGYTYTWTPSGGSASIASGLAVGVYTCTVRDTKLCTAVKTVTISFSPTSTIVATAAPSTVCSGNPITFTATPGAVSYTWSGGVTNGVPAYPMASGVYSVTGTYPAGCTASGTVAITVNTTPTVALGSISGNTICLGGSVYLNPAGSTNYVVDPGGLTGPSFTLSPATTTTYSLYAVSAEGCVSTNTIQTTITVNPKPVVGFASITNTNICVGALSVITPSGAATYTLLPLNLTGISFIVTPTVPTTYTVLGIDITAIPSCTNLAIASISVVPQMLPTITLSTPTLCLTRTATMTAAPIGGGLTYAWAPVLSIQGNSNGSSIVCKPINPGNIIYTVSVNNGFCTETQTMSLNVIKCSVPVLTFTALTNNSICTNGCVTFSATATGTPQSMSYDWIFEGGNPAAANTATAQSCYTLAGTYSISVRVSNGFGVDSILKLKYVEVADMPTLVKAFGKDSFDIGKTATLTATGAKYYRWFPEDGTLGCPTCSITTAQPSVTTQYTVVGYNSEVCSLWDTVRVKIFFKCGDFFVPNAFSPNGDGLNDMINVHGYCIKNYKMQIFNRWGEMMFETGDKNVSWDGNYRGKPLDTGVYIYRVEGETIDNKPFNVKGNVTLVR